MAESQPAAALTPELPAVCIADLHMAPERPDIIAAFLDFCAGPARAVRTVLILGDLFEVWIGDDDDAPEWHPVLDALHELTASGVQVHFLAGNRDFLVDAGFAARTGVCLMDAPVLADLGGVRTLLLHGDELCTDDADHQAFRREVRTHEWRAGFLARPLAERRRIAAEMRAASRESVSGKQADIMDVNPGAVEQAFSDWAAERMIHGHTHRPARHELRVAGRRVERWVLGDWFDQGSMLRIDHEGVHSVPLGLTGGR